MCERRRAKISSLDIRLDAKRFSKADWTDLYFDLYRQVFGEQSSEQEIFEDAKKRRETLRRYWKSWTREIKEDLERGGDK